MYEITGVYAVDPTLCFPKKEKKYFPFLALNHAHTMRPGLLFRELTAFA